MPTPAPPSRVSRTAKDRLDLRRSFYEQLLPSGPYKAWQCNRPGHRTVPPRLQYEGKNQEDNGRMYAWCIECAKPHYVSPPLTARAKSLAKEFCDQVEVHHQVERRMKELEDETKSLHIAGAANIRSLGSRRHGRASIAPSYARPKQLPNYRDIHAYGWQEDAEDIVPLGSIEDFTTTAGIIAYFEKQEIKRNELIAVFDHTADECLWTLCPIFQLTPEVVAPIKGCPFIWVKWGVTMLHGISDLIPHISPIRCPVWPELLSISSGESDVDIVEVAGPSGRKRQSSAPPSNNTGKRRKTKPARKDSDQVGGRVYKARKE